MKNINSYKVFVFLLSTFVTINAQDIRHNGVFKESTNPMIDSIMNSLRQTNVEAKKKLMFTVDFSKITLPKSEKEFEQSWHFPPVSQGNTGTCWCYSTTSLIESEIKRQSGKEIKLSEMYTVYWEYIEKAKEFVKTRGTSTFGEGSQANSVTRIMNTYGAVPLEAFKGNAKNTPFPDHSKMITEMTTFLNSIKSQNNWNEESVVSTIKSILNNYLGNPPSEFSYKGKTITPITFLIEELKIKPSEYVNIYSLKDADYWTNTEYKAADNWWHSNEYYNIPMEDWYNSLKKAVQEGYSFTIGGDVSEAGIDGNSDVAIIPSFDIPSEFINDDAKQFRVANGTTTDDHGVHVVGYKRIDNKDWFLIKDSGSGGFNGKSKGYYYFNEDFIKLKIMYFTVHESAVKYLFDKKKGL